MDREVFDVNNIFVQMLMVVHLQQLQISGLSTLAYSDLEQYLSGFLWKRALPSSLHEAADDVLKVTANDIVRYLSRLAITEGASGNLADFQDMIGG